MKLIDNVSTSTITGDWFFVRAGFYEISVSIASAATVTLQRAKSATAGSTTGTSLANLKDSDGTDLSITASTSGFYGVALSTGYVRASATGVSGGAVTVWFSPVQVTALPLE